jgi:hypothetical protein
MTTRKRQTTSPQLPSRKTADPRQQLALEHSALHTAQLGIARWTSGISTTQRDLAAALMPASQVQYHKKVQKDFQAWLDAGGFAADDVEAASPAPLAPAAAAMEAEPAAPPADSAHGPVVVG